VTVLLQKWVKSTNQSSKVVLTLVISELFGNTV
jgi:hypothetical protein